MANSQRQTHRLRPVPTAYFHYHYSKLDWTFIQVTCPDQSSQSTTNILAELQDAMHNPAPLPLPSPPTASTSVPMDAHGNTYVGKRKATDCPSAGVPQQYIRVNDDADDDADVPPLLPIQQSSSVPSPASNAPPTDSTSINHNILQAPPLPAQNATRDIMRTNNEFVAPLPHPANSLPCTNTEGRENDAENSDSASVTPSHSSQASQRQRRHRTKLGMPPKPNNQAERARTAENKTRQLAVAVQQLCAAGHLSPQPLAVERLPEQASSSGDVYSLPQVTCSNVSAIPTTERARFHMVVNGFCTSCLQTSTTPGHSPAERLVFHSKQAFEQFWASHAIDEQDPDEPL